MLVGTISENLQKKCLTVAVYKKALNSQVSVTCSHVLQIWYK
ncbi:hypothetical protein HanXRQr2_Chr02g0056521 [Helianthus annuus]|uniref:Uncharacterized protein n=1 Tax=Helianthus annuus TaxID=4232 RepID=A0A9K3JMH7_HELAN|nr:hypothetical protein HanXRQr2_Chr02g0056521 [Helianthus annuus]